MLSHALYLVFKHLNPQLHRLGGVFGRSDPVLCLGGSLDLFQLPVACIVWDNGPSFSSITLVIFVVIS